MSSNDSIEDIDTSLVLDTVRPKPRQPKQSKRLKRAGSIGLLEVSKTFKRVKSENDIKRPTTQSSTFNWVEKYAPQSVSEVAIHVRKVKDVTRVLQQMLQSSSPKLLVLSGSSGTGKSTLIKLLAQELLPNASEPCVEWNNTEGAAGNSGHVHAFSDFLDSVKYRNGGDNLSIILVEDMPYLQHEPTRSSFQQSVRHWCSSDAKLPPLVVCISESSYELDESRGFNGLDVNSRISVETVFGLHFVQSRDVAWIKFNAINKTLMTQTLGKIVKDNFELFSGVPKNMMKTTVAELAESGDLRSSILALEFWARHLKNGRVRGLLNFGKSSQLELFHLMGRIVFGTRKQMPESIQGTPVARNYALSNDIIKRNSFLSSNLTFVALSVLENYHAYKNAQLGACVALVDDLSCLDTFSGPRFDKDLNSLCFDATVRACRARLMPEHNRACAKSGEVSDTSSSTSGSTGAALGFPKMFKSSKNARDTKSWVKSHRVLRFSSSHRFGNIQDIILVDGFYEAYINQQKNFKYNSYRYSEAGGSEKIAKLQDWDRETNVLLMRPGGKFGEEPGSASVHSWYKNYTERVKEDGYGYFEEYDGMGIDESDNSESVYDSDDSQLKEMQELDEMDEMEREMDMDVDVGIDEILSDSDLDNF